MLTVGIGLVLYFTPVMSARSIIVTGIGAVTRDEVLDAAAVRPGTPLLQIDTDQVADRVAAIRRVASARVQREYPSALRITVVERIPVVVKDFPDGPHLSTATASTSRPRRRRRRCPTSTSTIPGPTDPPTKAALAVLTALRPEIAAQVGRIAAPSVASITLTLTDGRTVIWGTNDRTEEKAEKLAALLTQPGPHLRRVQSRTCRRSNSTGRLDPAKIARNSPAAFRRACIDPARGGHTVLFARNNLT